MIEAMPARARRPIRQWYVIALLAIGCGIASASALAQSPPSDADTLVMSTLRAALAPALPYPPSDEIGELPADGTSAAPWMVRPPQDGNPTIEVLANPLNRANQARAAKAMVQIEAAIEAAQKRSQAAYEKALADAKRTGRSQDFDGITLGDEGVAGARIDADGHVIIDVSFNQPAFSFTVKSSVEPAPHASPVSAAVGTISVPPNVYREGRDAGPNEHFCAAETHVFFGALAAPQVQRRSDVSFEVTAAASSAAAAGAGIQSVVVSLRGNAQLIDQIVRQADWSRVRALVTAN